MARKRLGKTWQMHVAIYPELGEEIHRVADERGMTICDFVMATMAKELGMEMPPARYREQEPAAPPSPQLELTDA